MLCSHHLDKAETARLSRMRVTHDVALLNLAVLFKQSGDFLFGEARMDTSHKQVRSGIDFISAVIGRTCVTAIATVASIGRRAASTRISSARGASINVSITIIAANFIFIAPSIDFEISAAHNDDW